MSLSAREIAVLYPGEMGARVGGVLRDRGHRVITTLVGRGGRTIERCRQAGIVVVDSFEAVVRRADVVISLVPPAAAEETALAWCALAADAPNGAIYVDANSIGPELVTELAEKIEGTGHSFIDAAINGLAKNLTISGTLFLSGDRAGEVAGLFGDSVRVRILGDKPGAASAMKMLLAGVSKGVCALFAELALLARRQQMLPQFTEAMTEIYGGIYTLIDRMLPTYRQHAGRRATEMCELEQTVRWAGQEGCVIAAVRELHEKLAAACLDAAGGQTASDVESFVNQLFQNSFLDAPRAGVSQR